MRLSSDTDRDEAVSLLADEDILGYFVLGCIAGALGLANANHNTGEDAAMASYRALDRLGWYGPRLWVVFAIECDQNITAFLSRIIEEERLLPGGAAFGSNVSTWR